MLWKIEKTFRFCSILLLYTIHSVMHIVLVWPFWFGIIQSQNHQSRKHAISPFDLLTTKECWKRHFLTIPLAFIWNVFQSFHRPTSHILCDNLSFTCNKFDLINLNAHKAQAILLGLCYKVWIRHYCMQSFDFFFNSFTPVQSINNDTVSCCVVSVERYLCIFWFHFADVSMFVK